MADKNPIDDLLVSLEAFIEPKALQMFGAVSKIITGARELSNSVQEQKPKATAAAPPPVQKPAAAADCASVAEAPAFDSMKVSPALEAAVATADARTAAYFEKPAAPVMGRVEINGRTHEMRGAGNIVIHGSTVFIDGVRHDLDWTPSNDVMEVKVLEGTVGNVIAMTSLTANRIDGNALVYGQASVGAIGGDATVNGDLACGSVTGDCSVEGDATLTSVAGSLKVGGSVTMR